MRFTPEQTLAIERREGDLLLDAGAGSGKTSVLVERFARAVHGGRRSASARSSRSPSPRRRPPSCASDPRAPARRPATTTAARATEGAWISTIHAFCARLLRTHALDGGPRPGVHGARRAATPPRCDAPPSTRRLARCARPRRGRADRRPRPGRAAHHDHRDLRRAAGARVARAAAARRRPAAADRRRPAQRRSQLVRGARRSAVAARARRDRPIPGERVLEARCDR